ncbi:hypothetical protein C1645_807946 [Glomus cerebriforme]|uniref:Uncharacterized protein n=1 Tax=Glomus cerebriforme TaxID=658196 RepID=A0A397SKF9_9GLOM|nr:hypothetical protein C1645_807946 [Glomus cerebriforme]
MALNVKQYKDPMISGEFKQKYRIKKIKIIKDENKMRKITEKKKERKENNKKVKKRIKSINQPKKTCLQTKTRDIPTCNISINKLNPTFDLPIHTIIIPTSSSERKTPPSTTSFPSTPTKNPLLIPSNDGKKISENNSPPLEKNNPKSPSTPNTAPPISNDPKTNNDHKGIKTNSKNNDNNNGKTNDNYNNNYNNNNNGNKNPLPTPTVLIYPSLTVPPLTSTTVSFTKTSNPNNKIFNPSSGPAITGMIFAIILALVAIAFIIRKTVYNKNYFRPFNRQIRHQQLLDNEGWPNYHTYDNNNMEVMSGNGSENASMNVITVLNRPQRTMSRRFSNFDDVTNVNSSNTGLLIDDEMSKNDDYSSGIKHQQEHEEHFSDDDYSSLDMSVDITLPPKIVNWEECMR